MRIAGVKVYLAIIQVKPLYSSAAGQSVEDGQLVQAVIQIIDLFFCYLLSVGLGDGQRLGGAADIRVFVRDFPGVRRRDRPAISSTKGGGFYVEHAVHVIQSVEIVPKFCCGVIDRAAEAVRLVCISVDFGIQCLSHGCGYVRVQHDPRVGANEDFLPGYIIAYTRNRAACSDANITDHTVDLYRVR